METSSKECIVITLECLPHIGECRRSHARNGIKPGRNHSGRSVSRRPPHRSVTCDWIDGFECLKCVCVISVVAHAETVKKSRSESMVFLDGGYLPLGDGLLQNIVEKVRLSQRRVVVHVRAEKAVLLRNFLVNSSGVIIFADNLLPVKHVLSHIPTARGAR